MPQKHTLDYVKAFFKEQGCECLADEYVGCGARLPYICSCGNRDIISFNSFRSGKRCRLCAIRKATDKTRHSLEYVKAFFTEQGCVCLADEYKNAHTPFPYTCECGQQSVTTFDNFQQGGRCWECGRKKYAEKRRHSLDYVKAFFKERGCECLADEYKNAIGKLPYICNCGRKSSITFSDFQSGGRCRACKYESHAENLRHTLEYVKAYFKEKGCECLAEEYLNDRQELPFICSCGRRCVTTFGNFRANKGRCIDCSGCKKHTLEYVKEFFKEHGCVCLADEYNNAWQKLSYVCVCGKKGRGSFHHFQQGYRCGKCDEFHGERLIASFLSARSVPFVREHRFSSCRHKRALPFDFVIGTKTIRLVEFHGMQHYCPTNFGSGDEDTALENLVGLTIRDNIKVVWASERKHPMIIIPYWDQARINELMDDFISGRRPHFSEPPKAVIKAEPIRNEIRRKYGLGPERLWGVIN